MDLGQIGRQHGAASSIEMEAIGLKKMSPLPENIRTINKSNIVCATVGAEQQNKVSVWG